MIRGIASLVVILVVTACAPDAVRAVRASADAPSDGGTVDTEPTTPSDSGTVDEDDTLPVDDDEPVADPGDEVVDDDQGADEPEVECDESERPTPNAGVVEPAGIGGCPAGMAPIAGACMDRWEAFLVALVDGAEVPFSPYFPVTTADVVIARSAAGAVPQAYVSGDAAASACANAGKRLCSDAEWTGACRGASDTVFPYGDTREPGTCNDARAAHPAVEYFGTSASWIWSELGNPCIGQQHDTVDATGANEACVDETGRFFDLMGNLHEWIADPNGTFRGGFYVDTTINGPGCLYRTTAHATSHWDYSTGFRCCADAP